jgi:hypothetical protein
MRGDASVAEACINTIIQNKSKLSEKQNCQSLFYSFLIAKVLKLFSFLKSTCILQTVVKRTV